MASPQKRIVIVGGGTAGITTAARLARRTKSKCSITLIEPAETHYYQPLWTLVGGGARRIEQSARPEQSLIPHGVRWLKSAATQFFPERNTLKTRQADEIPYDVLIVAPGLQIDWGKVKGLPEALQQDPRVCSNYDSRYAPKTWQAIKSFKGGSALFTSPSTPIKCGGAPQKIMYLADDAFRRQGVRSKSQVHAYFAATTIFGVPEYAKTLNEVVKRKQIEIHLRCDLTEVRPMHSEAVFFHLDDKREVVVPYDLLHATPPMSAPDFIKDSPFAVQDGPSKGWMAAHPKTLQNPSYPNVFAIGDVAAVPTSKTGAAIRKQAPVLVDHVLAYLNGSSATAEYDGYTSCPLITGYGKLVMAEFGYDNKMMPTFPIDQTKERWSMYQVKKYFLPWMYWNLMLRGRA